MAIRDEVVDYLRTALYMTFDEFYQPQIANKNTPKPFGVVRIGGDEAVPKQGMIKRIQVMVHTDREDYDDLDALVYQVITALNETELTSGIPQHTGTSGDFHDDDRETIFRIVEFEAVIVR
jgi:hypothetical protein